MSPPCKGGCRRMRQGGKCGSGTPSALEFPKIPLFSSIPLHFAGNYGIMSIALLRSGRRLAPLFFAGAASDPRLYGRG